jgi:hypothetical protein
MSEWPVGRRIVARLALPRRRDTWPSARALSS